MSKKTLGLLMLLGVLLQSPFSLAQSETPHRGVRLKPPTQTMAPRAKKALMEKIQTIRTQRGPQSRALLEDFAQKKARLHAEIQGAMRHGRHFDRKAFRTERKALFDQIKEINQAIKAETESRMDELSPKEREMIEEVAPNYVYLPLSFAPNDPLFGFQEGLQSINVDKISPPNGNAPKIVVAVVDQGIDFTHYDVENQAWTGGATCKDADNNDIPGGCPNGGYDVLDEDNDPTQEDGNDHGTKVATVIGAETNNDEGMASIGGDHVEIMAIRACCGLFGVFEDDDVAEGIYFAVNNGAQIINLSLGGPVPESLTIRAAIEYAQQNGVLVVAGAGDNGQDNDTTDFYPANFSKDFDNVISVTSLDKTDQILGNEGDQTIDLAAPGEAIVWGGKGPIVLGGTSTYGQEDGSSFSTAFVSGALAVFSRGASEGYLTIKQNLFNQLETLASLTAKVKDGKILRFKDPVIAPPAPVCEHILMTPEEAIQEDGGLNRVQVWWQPVPEADEYYLRMVSGPITFGDRSTPTNYRYATNLTPGSYEYEVRAVREGVMSEPCSGSFTAILPPPAPPAPVCDHPLMTPEEAIQEDGGLNRVQVWWQPVDNVDLYHLRMISGPTTFGDRATTVAYRYATSLTPGDYVYEVRAEKSGVVGPPCSGSFTAILPPTPPEAPVCEHPNLTPTEVIQIDNGLNRVKVWWQPVDGADLYHLRMVEGPTTFGDRSSSNNRRYATNLTPGDYTFEVRAEKAGIVGPPCSGNFTAIWP